MAFDFLMVLTFKKKCGIIYVIYKKLEKSR